MTEYFQARKSDPPTYHVPTEYPKHIYGGFPVQSDTEVKEALSNSTIKTRIVNSPHEEKILLDKGWVTDLMQLVKEPTLPGAVRNVGSIITGVDSAEDFTVIEGSSQPIKDEEGNETGEEIVQVRRGRPRKVV